MDRPIPRATSRLTSATPRARTHSPPGADPQAILRVLVIEDSVAYATLVTEMLVDGMRGGVQAIQCTDLSSAAEVLLNETVDVVLLDLSLPDAHKLEALQAVQAAAPEVPVVVLTGTDDPALGLEAVAAGAQDFLAKRSADPELLTRSLRYAVERKRAEVRLAEQALHDSLTGLPNRVLLIDRLNVALARAARRPISVAVLFLDLDRFKTINDSLGHEAGDQLLLEIASRLQSALRPGDTVARFGGDEFLILCEDLGAEYEAVRVGERAIGAISEPVVLADHTMSVGASVGIAFGTANAAGANDLIRQADAAMYRAKRRRTGIELYEAAMHREAMSELETEHRLRGAIERGELELVYQPQVSLVGGLRVGGAEALLRWRHPQRGLLSPGEFIPLAEETGLIEPIGAWVLDEACRQLAQWRETGQVSDDFTVSVNLSVRQLARPELIETVVDALARPGVPASSLCLEVTETYMAQDPVRAAQALTELRNLDVRLALDDFGTGYSSLSALSSYPLDVVKIDRSFIVRAGEDASAARMFAAVLGVARAAELGAVAEGVEEMPQLELLRRLGCDFVQGFIFARPLTPAGLVTLLNTPSGVSRPAA